LYTSAPTKDTVRKRLLDRTVGAVDHGHMTSADTARNETLPGDGFVARRQTHGWRCPSPVADAHAFHESLPGYAPTTLVRVPHLAKAWRVGAVLVKNESSRFGLPAFKALGASWAVARLLADRAGIGIHDLRIERLRELASDDPVTLVTATDGNHGRALARVGSWLGLPVEIVVPDVLSAAAEAAIAGEGANVARIDGSYDDAVAWAAGLAERLETAALVQDTAWDGYEQIPGWIVEGYETMLAELDEQLTEQGVGAAGLIAVPVGVGSLAQAVIAHAHRDRDGHAPVRVLSCEPDTAACVLASVAAGEPIAVATRATVMAGLNCGTVSSLAWPFLRDGLDAAVAVNDEQAAAAVAELAEVGIYAGASGSATLAGAHAALGDAERRAALGVGPDSVIVLLNTESGAGAGGLT
jgi:diaminopropionate ammonia-lyase